MSWRNILLIIAIIVLLASASAYTVFTIIGEPLGGRTSSDKTASTRDTPGPTYSVGPMTINLSAGGGLSGRVARAGIAFELDGEKTRRQVEQREEQVKDRVISTVRQQTAESIATNEGLDELRRQLKDAVNGLLAEGEVVDVYFFELVVP